MSFEERAEDLAANVASLGYDINKLIADGKLVIDHVRIEAAEIEGKVVTRILKRFFVRLDYAIKKSRRKKTRRS